MKSPHREIRPQHVTGGKLLHRCRNSCFKPLAQILLVLFVALVAKATDQPARIRVSELDRTPLTAGALKITLTQFRGSFLKFGNGSVEAQVEILRPDFQPFLRKDFRL